MGYAYLNSNEFIYIKSEVYFYQKVYGRKKLNKIYNFCRQKMD